MALTLISILTLANVALAAPVAQRDVACQATWISVAGDTCKSIGIGWGYYDTDILAANTFLNCDDIWVGTSVCIPDIPKPVTVTYPEASSTVIGTPVPFPNPVCSQTYNSVAGDNCDNIGLKFGITGTDVSNANTFLNCADIWQNTPICIPAIASPPTTPSCKSTYWSVAGDTCESIASQFGYYGYEISAANSFLNCNDIWANSPICLPGTPATPTVTVVPIPSCIATYISAAGDTCDSVAAQYGITGTQIYNANTFLDCGAIWTATPICVPTMVIVDPLPTDEPLPLSPADPITSNPPTDAVTSVTSDPPTDPATVPAATPTTTD